MFSLSILNGKAGGRKAISAATSIVTKGNNMTLVQTLKLTTTASILLMGLCALPTQADNWAKSEQQHHNNDKKQTVKNKAIVVEFFNKIFNERADIEQTALQYLAKDYVQHNPYVATGRQGFIDAMSNWLPYVPGQVAQIKRVIASGNLVMLHVHYHNTDSDALGSAVVDIFRVGKHGKIVEHWDVNQQIPEQMAHENGMF